jgi:hypothetical protein
MNTPPIIIKKSLIGLFLIVLGGTVLIAALALGLDVLYLQGQLDPQLYAFVSFAIIITLLATLISAYVYVISYIQLDDQGITVSDWMSLFSDSKAMTEWNKVQDVNIRKPGVLAQIADYGTLLVQTAGTDRNLVLPYIPNVEHWQEYIQAKADAAPELVKTV